MLLLTLFVLAHVVVLVLVGGAGYLLYLRSGRMRDVRRKRADTALQAVGLLIVVLAQSGATAGVAFLLILGVLSEWDTLQGYLH